MKELVVSRYFCNNMELVRKNDEIQTICSSRKFPPQFLSSMKQNESYTDKKMTNYNASLFTLRSNNCQAMENVLKNNQTEEHGISLQVEIDCLGFSRSEIYFSLIKSRILYGICRIKNYKTYKQKTPRQEYRKISLNHSRSQSKYFLKFTQFSKSFEGIIKLEKLRESYKSKRKTILKLADNKNISIKLQTKLVNPETNHVQALDQLNMYVININFEAEYFRNISSVSATNHLDIIRFVPPKSPYNLIEEILYHDPWALLAATIFLNKTSCSFARPNIFWFLVENPDPLSVINLFPNELVKYFDSLGLKNTRAVQIWRMSYDYIHKPWKQPKELYGIGNYGECAYRMFCLGDLSMDPTDKVLKKYKEWYVKILQ